MERETYTDELINDWYWYNGAIKCHDMSKEAFDMLNELKGVPTMDDGETIKLLPLQLEFLKAIQKTIPQRELLTQEQLSIAHCIAHGSYNTILHRDTLNKLIKKYAAKVTL